VPLDGASTLNDRTVALVLVRDEVLVLGSDGWVVVRRRFVIDDGVALLLARDVVVEDTQTVATVRVSHVVLELAQLLVLGAHVRIERGSNGRLLQIVPVGVAIGATSSVVANDVIRVGDPDGRRGLIGVEQRPRAAHVENQVALNQILALNGILNEDSVTHGVVSYIVLHTQVVHAMDGYSTVERMMDGIVAHIRAMHGADHVEMDGVRTEDEGLADKGQLNAVNSASRGLIAR